MIERVLATIKRFSLLEGGERVLVAVSGGPDSVCLLDVLFRLRERLNLELAVAHYNHMLRETAGRDQEFVRGLAERYSLPLHLGRGRPRDRGHGPEDAAREKRYAFLEDVAKRHGYHRVALGHTLTDNVETFFMRVIRGASLEGLKGIPPKRGIFIRPLLGLKREEVLFYLEERGLSWVQDETNLDTSYTRNWVRHELLPLLRKKNPRIEETVGEILEDLYRNWLVVDALVEDALSGLEVSYNGRLYIKTDSLDGVPDELRKQVLFKLLYRHFYPGRSGALSSCHVEGVLEMLGDSKGSKRVSLPEGIEAVREYDRLVIGPASREGEEGEVLVTGEGVYCFGEYIFSVKVGRFDSIVSAGRWCALFDQGKVRFPLIIRSRRPGDRLLIPGVGRKKLQDFFVDAKVPRFSRDKIPLLVSPSQGVLWIVGYRQREDLRPAGGDAILIEARRKG